MPGEQPFGGQRLVEPTRGVEHHLDDPLDMAVGRLEGADVHPQPPGDRRADLLDVERLPFDLAALDHVAGQRLENGLLPKVEPERLHVPDEPALPVADGGERLRELSLAPVEPGPVLKLMDIHSPHRLRRLWPRFAAGRRIRRRSTRGRATSTSPARDFNPGRAGGPGGVDAFHGSSRPTGPYPGLDGGPDIALGNLQVVARLQVEPALGRDTEVLLQPQSGVGGDAPPAVDELTNPGDRDVKVASELVLADAQGLHKLAAEDLPRRDRIENVSFFHRGSFEAQW